MALLTPDPERQEAATQWRDLEAALLVLGTAAVSLGVALVVTDADGRGLFSNAVWSALTGFSPGRSKGLGWMDALAGVDQNRLFAQLRSEHPVLRMRTQIRPEGRRGPRVPVQMTASSILVFDREAVGRAISFIPFASPEDPVALAGGTGRDTTTGLSDRSHFVDELMSTLARWQQPTTTVAVVVLDLDHAGATPWEHRTADPLFKAVAERLEGSIRPGDVLARTTGNQFSVLCRTITSFAEAIDLAERLLAVASGALDLPFRSGWSTVSAGVAFPHLPGETAERLLMKAEEAAALARSKGGARVEVIIGTGPGSSDATHPPLAEVDIDLTVQEHLSTASAPLQDSPPH